MNVRALRFADGAWLRQPAHVELPVDSRTAFEKELQAPAPAVLVVRSSDLPALRRWDNLIVDRGRQDQRKGLWAQLGGKKKVPLIAAKYAQTGRLVGGVERLLAQAIEHDERNHYVIGVRDHVFTRLWESNGAGPPTSWRASVRERGPGVLDARDVLDHLPPEAVPTELRTEYYIGETPEVELVRQLILKAAEVDECVLIQGPTGTGKENVARAIHRFGPRSSQPFRAVNTAAVAASLFESELFGSVKGAFTDAKEDRLGLWRAADGGTLLLDEIGDLALDMQTKVLRALESGRVHPVGAAHDQPVTARVVAATNRDLLSLVREGRFRSDLYYRLRAIMITTPALNEHPQDIALLAQSLWRRITADNDADLPSPVIRRLEGYGWPGNVRELRSVLATLRAYFPKRTPRVEDLDLVFAVQGQRIGDGDIGVTERTLALHRAECLRHLCRADEVTRACQVTIEPIITRKKADGRTVTAVHRALHYRLEELNQLCLRPLLFHSDAMFSAVNDLKGKLEYFHGLLDRNPREALGFLRREAPQVFKQVLSDLFKEVERVIVNASFGAATL